MCYKHLVIHVFTPVLQPPVTIAVTRLKRVLKMMEIYWLWV